jgi:hypothetical protein
MVAPLIGAGIRAAGAAARGLAKKFGKKTEEPSDFNRQELIGRRFYQMNPTLENEQFANDLADEVGRLEFQRAKEGGYDSILNPRKTGPGYFKKGGAVKKKSVSSASKRADGIAMRGKLVGGCWLKKYMKS